MSARDSGCCDLKPGFRPSEEPGSTEPMTGRREPGVRGGAAAKELPGEQEVKKLLVEQKVHREQEEFTVSKKSNVERS